MKYESEMQGYEDYHIPFQSKDCEKSFVRHIEEYSARSAIYKLQEFLTHDIPEKYRTLINIKIAKLGVQKKQMDEHNERVRLANKAFRESPEGISIAEEQSRQTKRSSEILNNWAERKNEQ